MPHSHADVPHKPAAGPLGWRLLPLVVLTLWFIAAAVIRHLPLTGDYPVLARLGNPGENDPLEISQAALLGLGCLVCLWAMVRSGRRKADFCWWVLPAFICFFMCWREVELDERYFHAHAFSWNYLFSDTKHGTSMADRLLLGVPSLSLTLVVLWLTARRAGLLLRAIGQRHVRAGLLLFVGGIGIYLVAQVYDRAHGLSSEHGILLPGFRGHRDDFWEEALEVAGALAIFMGTVVWYRVRPTIPGTLAEARETLARRVPASTVSPQPADPASPPVGPECDPSAGGPAIPTPKRAAGPGTD